MSSEQNIIRIILVDDHEVLRSGLRYILDVIDSIEVVGEASNGIEAIQLCKELKPDVVLMDLMMPEMDGIEATQNITRQNPASRVIVLSSSKDEDMVQTALEAGAVSYLTKNVSSADLTTAIKNAYSGISTLSPDATQALIQAKTRPQKPDFDFSAREIQILEKLVAGYSNPEIADDLFVSRSTVKRHVSNILAKLKVNSRTEAVALAMKYKIVK